MENIVLNENIRIWRKYSNLELCMVNNYWELTDSELFLSIAYHEPPTKIYICEREFDVIPEYMALRTKSSDGYFRFIYIQINVETGEYYIGKVNRQRLSEFRKYQGSGLRFKAKYNKHKEEFVRYYIAACQTAKETEELEAKIVNKELLKDPFCLNLVQGGGGVNRVKTSEGKKQRQREYMKAHPERYRAMLEAHKKLYNPYAESLFKTLKYMPNYQPKGLNDLVTPNERHAGLDKAILEARIRVYEAARAKHPERWTKGIRKWEYQGTEWLNPRQEKETKNEAKAS